MQEPVAGGSGDLHLCYHQFMVIDYGAPPDSPDGDLARAADRTGMAASRPGLVLILSGIHTGSVHVTATAYETAPAVDTDAWEDIVEVSVHSAGGTLGMQGLLDYRWEELPNLACSGPGDYRVRVCANGRDTAAGLTPEDPVEDYLVAVWPAEPREPVVHKMTSQYGAELRAR